MGEATPLSLRPDLPYPITLTRLVAAPGTRLRRGDRLLEYSFTSATRRRENAAAERDGKPVPPERRKDDMVGSWESPIDGEVVSWSPGVHAGMVIEQRHASKPLVLIEQPCTHPVQIHGMCGVCGADLTNDDYLSRPAVDEAGPSRYPGSFELAHDALGVTVSSNEAKRLETLSRDSLLASRRLSLIVDLDQTIIHTTVDPTVGEWMNEVAEDEKEEEKENQGETTEGGARSTTPPLPKREKNPNAEALRDVARFQLADDLPPGAVKGKSRRQEPVRWYYTKPRPGLKEFLSKMNELYEMHVYTMGTRTYADAICKVIDPEGTIFGGRVLSRDESGSMSSKSLMRLFPTDQSMVVIIDDRADVWGGDCPNLVKVIPYDFFIGIGDINGSFLPPTQPTITPIPAAGGGVSSPTASSMTSSDTSTASSPAAPQTPPEIPSTEDGLLRQSKLLDELAEKRPLAKLEEETERAEEEAEASSSEDEKGTEGVSEEASAPTTETTSAAPHAPHPHTHHRKALLNSEDHELERVAGILRDVHSTFYTAYDDRDVSSGEMPMECDTPLIIEEIKDRVLSGCVIAFTGVIPRNVEPEASDIWKAAESFGARCVHDLSDRVTHLVTATLGTEKMHRAARLPRTKIVWLTWLQSSIALWKREPEEPFLAHRIPGDDGRGVASRPDSPGRPAWVDADGDTTMTETETPKASSDGSGDAPGDDDDSDGPVDAFGHHVSDDDLAQDAAALDSAWDDAAQREFDAFLEDGSDDGDDEDEKDDKDADGDSTIGGSGSDKGSNKEEDEDSDVDDEELERERARRRSSRAATPSIWSRAATPGPSILSRAPTPAPGSPKHVRYADEENMPLEEVREPQPGDIPSFPAYNPRKRARLLLQAPTPEDEVPEANRMTYRAPGSLRESHTANGGETSESEGEDEFAKMLADSLKEEGGVVEGEGGDGEEGK